MLAQDNAVGMLRRGSEVVLDFMGRNAPKLDFGPVTQPSTVQGQLVRIGGRDATSHGLIEDFGGRIWKILTTRDVARQMSPVLYGPPIRVSGIGRWYRSELGEWNLDELRLQSWERMPETTLREGISSLRNPAPTLLEGFTTSAVPAISMYSGLVFDDPIASLEELRGSDEKGK
jgi:hypothetical protein